MKTKKAKTSSKAAPIIRVATITNPKTKRVCLVRVTADGRLVGARYARHFGVKKVATWTEVEARSWAQATKAVRGGKGKQVHARRSAPKMQLKRAA
ncbi:MAG: hypothetical protein ACRDGN_18115 [bacterium]